MTVVNRPDLNRIYTGDCAEIMATFPDGSFDAIITDPVWPNTSVPLRGSDDPYNALARAAVEFPRLAKTVVIHLGCDSDLRILMAIPRELPFVRVSWLRYSRPHYKGNILYGADVAYVFGTGRLPEGRRVLPGEVVACRPDREPSEHPCPRKLEHVKFLVASYTKEKDRVLDPFSGGGTTLVACLELGRKYVGIEIEPEYVKMAESRIAQEMSQGKML